MDYMVKYFPPLYVRKIENNINLFALYISKLSCSIIMDNSAQFSKIIHNFTKLELVYFHNQLATYIMRKIESGKYIATNNNLCVNINDSSKFTFNLDSYVKTRIALIISSHKFTKLRKNIGPSLSHIISSQLDYNYINENFISELAVWHHGANIRSILKVLSYNDIPESPHLMMENFVRFIEKTTKCNFLYVDSLIRSNTEFLYSIHSSNNITIALNFPKHFETDENEMRSLGLRLNSENGTIEAKPSPYTKSFIKNTLKLHFVPFKTIIYELPAKNTTSFNNAIHCPKNVKVEEERDHWLQFVEAEKPVTKFLFKFPTKTNYVPQRFTSINSNGAIDMFQDYKASIYNADFAKGITTNSSEKMLIVGIYVWLIYNGCKINYRSGEGRVPEGIPLMGETVNPRFVIIAESPCSIFINQKFSTVVAYFRLKVYKYDKVTRNIWSVFEYYEIEFNGAKGEKKGYIITNEVDKRQPCYMWRLKAKVNFTNSSTEKDCENSDIGADDVILPTILKKDYMDFYNIEEKEFDKSCDMFYTYMSNCAISWSSCAEEEIRLQEIFEWDSITSPDELPFKCEKPHMVMRKHIILEQIFKDCFVNLTEFKNIESVSTRLQKVLETRIKLVFDFIDADMKQITKDHIEFNEETISIISEIVVTKKERIELGDKYFNNRNPRAERKDFILPIVSEICSKELLLYSKETCFKIQYYNRRFLPDNS